MAPRSDQLAAAHRYLGRRLASALATGEQNPVDPPGRRIWLALFVSGVLAVAVFAGVSLSVATGSDSGSDQSWRYEGAYIVERETGARFYLFDGRLHPVLNYATVRLVAGTPDLPPEHVSGAELVDLPRGPQLGIPGAPDSIPDAERLLGPGEFGPGKPIDVPPGRGAVVAAGETLYLVTDELKKFRLVRGTGDALTALGYARVAPLDVSESWLEQIPNGPALDPALARKPLTDG